MATNPLICPNCNRPMNHHADKVIYPPNPAEVEQLHVELGGVLEETHACPGCGAVASRKAE